VDRGEVLQWLLRRVIGGSVTPVCCQMSVLICLKRVVAFPLKGLLKARPVWPAFHLMIQVDIVAAFRLDEQGLEEVVVGTGHGQLGSTLALSAA